MKVDLSAFSRWALDEARSRDERYLIFLVCEECRRLEYRSQPEEWKRQHGFQSADWRFHNEMRLNPLMEAPFGVVDTERAARFALELKKLELHTSMHKRRVGEAGAVLRFFPALEHVKLDGCDMADISFVEELPNLKSLQLCSALLSDLGPLRACTGLEELTLGFTGSMHPVLAPRMVWLDGTPLGALKNLRKLRLYPNAGILKGLCFPKLETLNILDSATVHADCSHLPEMPVLRHLALDGVQSLAGISRFPELRSLTVGGELREWGDLPELKHLDCLEVRTKYGWPQDLAPLAGLEALRWVQFDGEMPRNYWPLTGAPRLCELVVKKPLVAPQMESVVMEVCAVNAVLHPWEGVFGTEERRVPPPLKFVALGRWGEGPKLPCREPEPGPEYLAHPKMFHLELQWMARKIQEVLVEFGAVMNPSAVPQTSEHNWSRFIHIEVETLEALQKLPELLEALRGVMALSPKVWMFNVGVNLRITKLQMTPQQQKWIEQIERRSEEWEEEKEFERYTKTQQHLIETEFRMRMNEQEGEELVPEDFVPPKDIRPESEVIRPYHPADDEMEEADFDLKPYDEQDNEDDDGGGDDSNVKVAPPPQPDPDFINDPYAHPLASSCRLYAQLTWEGFYINSRNVATAIQFMRRPLDEDYRDEEE